MNCKLCGAELVYQVVPMLWLDRIGSSLCDPTKPNEDGYYVVHVLEEIPSIEETIERLQEIVADLS